MEGNLPTKTMEDLEVNDEKLSWEKEAEDFDPAKYHFIAGIPVKRTEDPRTDPFAWSDYAFSPDMPFHLPEGVDPESEDGLWLSIRRAFKFSDVNGGQGEQALKPIYGEWRPYESAAEHPPFEERLYHLRFFKSEKGNPQLRIRADFATKLQWQIPTDPSIEEGLVWRCVEKYQTKVTKREVTDEEKMRVDALQARSQEAQPALLVERTVIEAKPRWQSTPNGGILKFHARLPQGRFVGIKGPSSLEWGRCEEMIVTFGDKKYSYHNDDAFYSESEKPEWLNSMIPYDDYPMAVKFFVAGKNGQCGSMSFTVDRKVN